MRYLILLTALFTVLSCSGNRVERKPRPVRSTPKFVGDMPNMLRGTIKQHVALMGYSATYSDTYEPLIAAGYGLVIGLNRTGSSEIPPQVRAHMVADLARRGVGESTSSLGSVSPEELLNSDQTAVVIVEAVIPQAASGRKPARESMRPDHPSLRGTLFDVHVFAEPSSSTTSLEGGYLIPTNLRMGQLTTGKEQAREVAVASGPVFINPFAEPNSIGKDSVHRTSGRILEGGEALNNMPMRLVLIEPSHTRASMIQTAINRVFPQEQGQDGPTAHGMSDEQIEIRVPPSWKDDVPTFMNLMTHITMRLQNPESVAMSVKRLLISDPSPKNADAATWRWISIGDRSLAIVRQLYDHPDELPRLAALRTGGHLDDPLCVPQLIEMATSEIGLGSRLDAIDLLEKMPKDPRIEFGLRPLLNIDDIEVRLRVAETLVSRNDPIIKKITVGEKFELVLVPSEHNMVYVTQTGIPQIILMGDMEIKRPLTLNAWGNNLIIRDSEENPDFIDVRYRDEETGSTKIECVTSNLPIFTLFLAHETTPEEPAPGLNLTYSRTIGALHSLWRQQYLEADFKVEQDRLLAMIERLATEVTYTPRPEFKEETESEAPPRFLEPSTTTTMESEESKP
ncbi:MAG: flagellar basal body P-ring protein FlgI [Phycisphaerales bacterium]|jgi:flagellar basal body P-ring protein FlgI|nr:flagellar basal body P-ring protein FlgI [Phycisphaerales bacterium]